MGKFHIHKMKWSGGKPFFFFTNLNNTVIRFINVKQKKAFRTSNIIWNFEIDK